MRAPFVSLTPREREVLALLRRGLTNEEIASHLGITLDGAKYHVSQMLSKLGVATREEAAALAIGEPRRWWAAWPLWAKIATTLTVVVGIAAFSWAVLIRSEGEEDITGTGGSEAELSEQDIVERVLSDGLCSERDQPDASSAKATLTTRGEALRVMRQRAGQSPPVSPREDETVWLVEVRGKFACGFSGFGVLPSPTPRPGTLLAIASTDGRVKTTGGIWSSMHPACKAGHLPDEKAGPLKITFEPRVVCWTTAKLRTTSKARLVTCVIARN